ncbi:GntR family transcriptional regulator [Agrococcus sp. ARC_14]|uniref:GntR family transcriptional regulator n=1 Tax=Agrococcus sp. ARC_14 TaxID=2919927 RepID=UPI001F05DCC5|nr:GntR family transcriptional regulator [Agrococcus sp. ARC_14]MCH1881791.1 GntR family transcriptional regulator [Agrococcus sp. ARC_14]
MAQTTTDAMQFERIEAGSLVNEARRQIRRSILAGSIRPGERLKDSVLAEQMGISRSPVREALRLLEQSGLVEKTANRSYRIPTFAAEDFEELAALRAADEVLAIRVIVSQRLPLDSLEAAIQEIDDAGADPAKGAAADAAFHAAVVRLAGFPRLVERYSGLVDQIRLMLLASEMETWGRDARLLTNHTRLMDELRRAMDGGDMHRLIRAWEDHVFGMQPARSVHPL